MERYATYKDSGVEWIGKIPERWVLTRTKAAFVNKKRVVGDRANAYQRLSLTMQGVLPRGKDDREGLQPEQFEGYQVLEANELVFKLIDLQNIKTSRVGLSPYTGIVSPAYIILARPNSDNRYFYYWFFALYQQNVFNQLGGNGVRSALNKDDLLNLPMLIPGKEEQCKIADYLDAKTAEIDALIADCEREVELLREYRKAVISEAVTKGFDPDAPMKDSGVEWVGKIPADWYCAKLGLISVSTLGRMLDTEKQTGDCPAPYLSNRDVQWFHIDDSDLKEMDFPYEIRSSYEIHDGDMLVCEGGEVGRSTVWHGPTPAFFFQKAIHRVRFDTRVMDPDFAAYQMFQKAQVTMFREVRKGESTIGHLPGDQLRQLTFVVPPIEQQRAIVSHLNFKTAEIDSLIEARRSMADKLREYRKSLVSEAVTGKFKVPGIQG